MLMLSSPLFSSFKVAIIGNVSFKNVQKCKIELNVRYDV